MFIRRSVYPTLHIVLSKRTRRRIHDSLIFLRHSVFVRSSARFLVLSSAIVISTEPRDPREKNIPRYGKLTHLATMRRLHEATRRDTATGIAARKVVNWSRSQQLLGSSSPFSQATSARSPSSGDMPGISGAMRNLVTLKLSRCIINIQCSTHTSRFK